CDYGSGTIADHNTNRSINPLFVNAAAFDFALQAASPAIDAGMMLSAVPTDLVGIPRPQGAGYDIGAYESVADPPTSASLSASLPSPVVGQSVTFTVTISGGTAAARSGELVNLQDGATTLGTVPVDAAGNATLTTAALCVGCHTICASYAGDVAYG